MGRKPVYRDKIRELLRQNVSPNEIVRQVGCSKGAVWKASNELRQEGFVFPSDSLKASRQSLHQAILDRHARGMLPRDIANELHIFTEYVSNVVCRKGNTRGKVSHAQLNILVERIENLEMQMEICLDLLKDMK